ncbi:MAG: hypothetical protein HC843_14045 [Sphingomonadales bacterium]|nr:hypothetical protein [Sphingomonadales bacterium]
MTDPNGQIIYSFYDALDRKIAHLDQSQYLTHWNYDSDGNVTRETLFAARFNADGTFTGGLTQATSVATLISHSGATNSANRITEYNYDRLGNRTLEKRLAVEIYDASNVAPNSDTVLVDATVFYEYNALSQVTKKPRQPVTSIYIIMTIADG